MNIYNGFVLKSGFKGIYKIMRSTRPLHLPLLCIVSLLQYFFLVVTPIDAVRLTDEYEIKIDQKYLVDSILRLLFSGFPVLSCGFPAPSSPFTLLTLTSTYSII